MNFLERNFSDFFPDEIRYALDLAISGKIEVDSRCFENFSCEHVARILNAYKQWGQLSPKHCYPWYNDQSVMASIQKSYERFLAGNRNEYFPQSYYFQLVHSGYLEFNHTIRAYQRMMMIIELFEQAQSKGMPAIYVRPKEIIVKS